MTLANLREALENHEGGVTMQVVAIDSLGRENVSDRVAASGLDRKAAEARARELNALYGDACHGACSRRICVAKPHDYRPHIFRP